MSVKRSSGAGRGSATLGGGEVGGKVDGQELYKDLQGRGDNPFTSVDIALATGAGEPQVARTLMGLHAEGVLVKEGPGKYRASGISEMTGTDFQRVFTRANKIDATRIRDLQEIDRLKRNNDIMRARLLKAQSERDHYLAALQARGIDAGPVPLTETLERAEARAAMHSEPPPPPSDAPAASDDGSDGQAAVTQEVPASDAAPEADSSGGVAAAPSSGTSS